MVPINYGTLLQIFLPSFHAVQHKAIESKPAHKLHFAREVELICLLVHELVLDSLNPLVEWWLHSLFCEAHNFVIELSLYYFLINYVLVQSHYDIGL